jgi:hypothetical protein
VLALLALLAGCAAPPPPAPPRDLRTRDALVGRWQSVARTMRLGTGVPRLNGADGNVIGQEVVFLPDGQIVIESQLDGSVDLDVATGTYDILTQNLLAIVRYPRKPLGPGEIQEEIRYTFYFDRGTLVLNRDREKLVFRRVAGPDPYPPAAPPPAPAAEGRSEPAAAAPARAGASR